MKRCGIKSNNKPIVSINLGKVKDKARTATLAKNESEERQMNVMHLVIKDEMCDIKEDKIKIYLQKCLK